MQGEQIQSFQKPFQGNISFICGISLQPQLENENKIFKDYISIFAIVNYRNWLNAFLPSSVLKMGCEAEPQAAAGRHWRFKEKASHR